MKLPEIGRMIPEGLKRRNINVGSFEEFTKQLSMHDSTFVTAECLSESFTPLYFKRQRSVPSIELYYTVYTADSATSGKRITYIERQMGRVKSWMYRRERKEHERKKLEQQLMTLQTLEDVQKQFPHMGIMFRLDEGVLISQEQLDEIYNNAERLGL